MSMSLDDLLKLFKQWKTDGRHLIIELRQDGHTNIWVRASVWEATEKEVEFAFGYPALAWGRLVIPFSGDLFSARLLDPSDPRPLEPISPDFELCIEITWKLLSRDIERCMICVLRKI